ncbi:Uncharacterized protein Rs2_36710 [Raphanus sativus]|nr:Uncharacterized protein Rs2_36710 [Raphanus sativus]
MDPCSPTCSIRCPRPPASSLQSEQRKATNRRHKLLDSSLPIPSLQVTTRGAQIDRWTQAELLELMLLDSGDESERRSSPLQLWYGGDMVVTRRAEAEVAEARKTKSKRQTRFPDRKSPNAAAKRSLCQSQRFH